MPAARRLLASTLLSFVLALSPWAVSSGAAETMVINSPLPQVTTATDPTTSRSDVPLVSFAAKYMTSSVLGGFAGYALADTLGGQTLGLVGATLAGSTLGGLTFLLWHGVHYENQSNYR